MSSGERSTFLLVVLLGLLLYLPFLAIQYDTNGMVEADSLEQGMLLAHNHLAYRPIGFFVYSLVQEMGYTGNSLHVFQVINGICGALSLGFCYLAFAPLLKNRVMTLLTCVFWGTTFTTWYASTDATYMELATTFASAAIALSIRGNTQRHAIWCGILTAACVLTWQAGIFLVPGLVACWLIKNDRRPIATLLAASGGITLATYVLVGVMAFEVRSLGEFMSWIFRYGNVGTLPLWGHWGVDRIAPALENAVRSLVPTPLMVNPFDLFEHPVQLGRLAVDLSVGAVAVLLLGSAIHFVRRMETERRWHALALLTGYVSFIPFIVWWDPRQPMWWIIPNLYLAGLVGLAWGSAALASPSGTIFTLSLGGLALTNFVTIVHPRHAELGQDRTIAQCVAEHTQPRDLMLVANWGWPDYLPYLHHRSVLNLIGNSLVFQNKGDHLSMVRQAIQETESGGGRVFMPAPEEYDAGHLVWLESQTRLTLADLESFPQSEGFACPGQTFRRVAAE